MSLVAQLENYPFLMSIARINKNFDPQFIEEYHQGLAEETKLPSVLIGKVEQAIVLMLTLPDKFGILEWVNVQEIIKKVHKTLYKQYQNQESDTGDIVNFNILITHKQSTVGVGFGKPRDSDRTNEVFYPYSNGCKNNEDNLNEAFKFIYNELYLSV